MIRVSEFVQSSNGRVYLVFRDVGAAPLITFLTAISTRLLLMVYCESAVRKCVQLGLLHDKQVFLRSMAISEPTHLLQRLHHLDIG